MTAIKATFADFRVVKTRAVAQLIFECPLEQADAALATLGGLPQASKERWCGIARLDVKAIQESPEMKKTGKRFDELPLSSQCAIRCTDHDFIKWLGHHDAANTTAFIRMELGIDSRSELNTNEDAAKKWRDIDANYEMHCRGMR